MKINQVIEGLRDAKDNPCWKGYKPVGTKKKNGKTVPNCVPKEGVEEAVATGKLTNIQPGVAAEIDHGNGTKTQIDLKKNPSALAKDAQGKLTLNAKPVAAPGTPGTTANTPKIGDKVEIATQEEIDSVLKLAGVSETGSYKAPTELGFGPGFRAPITAADYEEIARKKAAGKQQQAAQGTVKWPTTDAEIKAFQTANKLTPDGKIGSNTMTALQKAGAKPPAGFKPVANKVTTKGGYVPGSNPSPSASPAPSGAAAQQEPAAAPVAAPEAPAAAPAASPYPADDPLYGKFYQRTQRQLFPSAADFTLAQQQKAQELADKQLAAMKKNAGVTPAPTKQ
jgi:hypothetical protein